MRSRKHAVGILAIVALGFAVPAAAQQPSSTNEYPECKKTPTAAESDEAHKKYIAGKSSYDTGKYDVAIQRFREAYAKDCTKHELLVILSRAYEFNNDLPAAIHALETYLDRVKDAPDEKTYRDRITTLKEKLGKTATSASATPPPPPPPASTTPPPPPPPPEEKPAKHSVYPLLLGATGGLAITAGILLEVLKPALPYNCDPDTAQCDFQANFDPVTHKPVLPKKLVAKDATAQQKDQLAKDQDKAGTEESLKTAGIVCIVSGAALLVGAAVWFFVEPTISSSDKDKADKKIITPQVGPGYAGLSFGGSF